MIDAAERRSFLFGITLTEILVLFVFLLALLIGGNMENRQAEASARKNLPEKVFDLQEELVGTRQRMFDTGEQMTLLKSQYQQIVDENAALKDMVKSESAIQKNPEHEAVLSALTPLLNPETVEFLKEVTDTLRQDLGVESLAEKTDLLSDLLDASKSKVEACTGLLSEDNQNFGEFEMDIQECTGRLRYFERTYAEGISDVPPPCWISVSGRSESLFFVNIDTEGFEVGKAWAPGRQEDAAQVVGALPMIGKKLDSQQFLAATEGLFEQSRQLKCRHVVDVYDKIDKDKELYKARMKIIEARFYKNLRG
ncbi:hypothetical protein [Granulosicoccus antarcticus]|uniref:Uncharacterized protein n=1 Tax=Granulosicoccus antarcticus IMCC3135 TaxID=1192854 RepID=A0A2Z2NVI7_9GAMM|nr:hypothetical protein [Granulosicoccus antarcticus]ASJ72800.1 hypothetical protein IMCC3135_13575 [Granulosicoccus antarcticus IMCC3135]